MKQLLFIILLTLFSCSLQKSKDNQDVVVEKAITKPLPPEKTEELLQKTAGNWAFGQGIGETILTAGTIFAFPPYAIYVVGNGALSLAGYERLALVDVLPDETKSSVNSVYDTVTEVPGRVNAKVSGREFRTSEKINEDMKQFLDEAYTEKNSKQEKK